MTYDRKYDWSKEIEYRVELVYKPHDYRIVNVEGISTDDIRLPTERYIKTRIQKALHELDLMYYQKEFGKNILLRSQDPQAVFNCKAWCSGDHVIGLEIEYDNIEAYALKKIKQDVETYFSHYKIIWTKLKS